MIEPSAYLTFLLASIAIVIVPGPTVTMIIANALNNGTRAGLANVAGTQAGLAIMLVVLATGLELVIQAMGHLFDVIKLIGAAYLAYLGIRMLMNRSGLAQQQNAPPSRAVFFWQGMLVIWSNPKALLLFGAFIPQFINPNTPVFSQIIILGVSFMAVATCLDGVYAILAGQARHWLTHRRIRTVEIFSGIILVCGGVWLALTRQAI